MAAGALESRDEHLTVRERRLPKILAGVADPDERKIVSRGVLGDRPDHGDGAGRPGLLSKVSVNI